MIRQLSEKDDVLAQQLIQQKPAENLFIIGDIEAFGYEQDFQKIWGDFDEKGELRAILLKYEKNYLPFSLGSFDAKGFAEIINNDPNKPMLSGLKDITSQIEPYLKITYKQKREFYYAKCTTSAALPSVDTSEVKQITLEDVERLGEFLTSVPEFVDMEFSPERKKRNLKQGVTRGYYIEKDGDMVATASTTAENSSSAMVVGVATRKDYKQLGLATKCLTKLCHDLLAEQKQLCLFYDNPQAGKIYKQLGFQDIGYWTMYQ
ncbi:N-acetyltransferase [Paraliobacillus quinghaiensis]|uniref:N-acetyltransferase n=1 Tax=Paraliobacillus quinghaiensis TaxID=470815 RepID=A0A917WVI2_9BACI|nr:GNAT family N-acetyltransferase [Paraliobacillus quinghaiensis]GGM32839.1 N-acetyltransferase [Paraliobacillus quinghaiensis]